MSRTIVVDDQVAEMLDKERRGSESNWRVVRRLMSLDEAPPYVSMEEFEQSLRGEEVES